jgi:hypothetical protein
METNKFVKRLQKVDKHFRFLHTKPNIGSLIYMGWSKRRAEANPTKYADWRKNYYEHLMSLPYDIYPYPKENYRDIRTQCRHACMFQVIERLIGMKFRLIDKKYKDYLLYGTEFPG